MKTKNIIDGEAQLIKGSHNSTRLGKGVVICAKGMRCHSLKACRYCFQDKKEFMQWQVDRFWAFVRMDQFFTVNFCTTLESATEAIAYACMLRTKFLRRVSKFKFRYISVCAATQSNHAHIHILWDCDFDKTTLQKYFIKELGSDFTIVLREVKGKERAVRLIGYLFDQNLKKSFQHKSKFLRPLSASKPFSYGRSSIRKKESLSYQMLSFIEGVV